MKQYNQFPLFPSSADPSGVANGDFWYDSSFLTPAWRTTSVTKRVASTDGNGVGVRLTDLTISTSTTALPVTGTLTASQTYVIQGHVELVVVGSPTNFVSRLTAGSGLLAATTAPRVMFRLWDNAGVTNSTPMTQWVTALDTDTSATLALTAQTYIMEVKGFIRPSTAGTLTFGFTRTGGTSITAKAGSFICCTTQL